jgi:hypothetical protein
MSHHDSRKEMARMTAADKEMTAVVRGGGNVTTNAAVTD